MRQHGSSTPATTQDMLQQQRRPSKEGPRKPACLSMHRCPLCSSCMMWSSRLTQTCQPRRLCSRCRKASTCLRLVQGGNASAPLPPLQAERHKQNVQAGRCTAARTCSAQCARLAVIAAIQVHRPSSRRAAVAHICLALGALCKLAAVLAHRLDRAGVDLRRVAIACGQHLQCMRMDRIKPMTKCLEYMHRLRFHSHSSNTPSNPLATLAAPASPRIGVHSCLQLLSAWLCRWTMTERRSGPAGGLSRKCAAVSPAG